MVAKKKEQTKKDEIVVEFRCGYRDCVWPDCRKHHETAINHPLCEAAVIEAERKALHKMRFVPAERK
mgnify:CR=1 FL=1